jgi:Phosphoheptose isomerase
MHIQFPDTDEILRGLLERHPALLSCREQIETAHEMLQNCFQEGGKLLLCGNGGSAADALHISGELMKSFVVPRTPDPAFSGAVRKLFPSDADFLLQKLEPALPAITLVGNASASTAVQNDISPLLVFAQQVYALGKKNDILFGISTSGNSQNIIYAAETARALGMGIITLTGRGPNGLSPVSDCQIAVDETETFLVQELHLPVYHALCLMLEHDFFAR